MRQQLLEFVERSTAPRVALDRRAVEDVVKHMAAAIVAVLEEGVNDPDDELSSGRQDQE